MGLDMYAYTMPNSLIGDQQTDIKLPGEGYDSQEVNMDFDYFRKFHQLHGWMRRLYAAKGGQSEEFNCNTVRLMPEDIDALERDASGTLPDEEGFFFGNYPDNGFDDERKRELAEFIAKCREAFAEGRAVVYDSWW